MFSGGMEGRREGGVALAAEIKGLCGVRGGYMWGSVCIGGDDPC